MQENEPRDEPSDPGRHVPSAEDLYEDGIQLRPLLRSIWPYRRVIVGVVAGVMIVFATFAMVMVHRAPTERMGTLGFRLLFDESKGRYPNGMPFSTSEITSTPVLTEVFDANGLDRFGSYEDFRNTLFVLQMNPTLAALSYEYLTMQADPELTPADLANLRDELQTARQDSSFTLNFRQNARIATLPQSLTAKILADTLAVWATQAVEHKGVLLYDISVLSGNILKRNIVLGSDYFRGIDILRTQIVRILANIRQIEVLPGAALLRSGDDRVSLEELNSELEDILRFQIQPLLGILRETGLSKDPTALKYYVSDKLFQNRLDREEAQERVRSVQAALREYMGRVPETAGSGSEGANLGLAQGNQARVSQFGDSALDRLMDIAAMSNDADYRQMITDQVISEGLDVARLEREQANYEEVFRATQYAQARANNSPEIDELTIQSGLEEAFDAVVRIVDYTNAIYEELSAKNLTPQTLLYSVSSPFTQSTERSIVMRDIGSSGLLVFMLSLIIVAFGCLGHSYFQREAVRQATDEQGARKAL